MNRFATIHRGLEHIEKRTHGTAYKKVSNILTMIIGREQDSLVCNMGIETTNPSYILREWNSFNHNTLLRTPVRDVSCSFIHHFYQSNLPKTNTRILN